LKFFRLNYSGRVVFTGFPNEPYDELCFRGTAGAYRRAAALVEYKGEIVSNQTTNKTLTWNSLLPARV